MDLDISPLMTNIQVQERQKFKKCVTPQNETGHCMPIQICSVPNVASSVEEFMKNVCTIDEVFIGICCPEFPAETITVEWDNFMESNEGHDEDAEVAKECGKLPAANGSTNYWPWIVPLAARSTGKVFCGGTLINEQYVLTAAHCTTRIPQNQILARLTLPDSKETITDFAVIEIKRHSLYNPRTMQGDIALLKLSRSVTLGNFRRLVCLPGDEAEDYTGKAAVFLGWKESSGQNVEEYLPMISNKECQNTLGQIIADSVLCAGPRIEEPICNDDSGAPLLVFQDGKFSIVGLLARNRNDCDGQSPSVFTRISSYLGWIENHSN